MKRVKLIWLAALAAFALSAVAISAPSASAAEPEWGHCVPVKSKGHFEDGNCTKEDFKENKKHERKYKGKFEWDATAAAACYPQKHGHYEDSGCTKEKFKEKNGVKSYKGKYEKTGGSKFEGNGGAGVLSTVLIECTNEKEEYVQRPREQCASENEEGAATQGYSSGIEPAKVECTSEHATGEATGTDEVGNISVRFKGCTYNGIPATTKGLPAGEIQVNPLKGRLGYINKASHEVGVLLEPATAGGEFAEFELLDGEAVFHVGVGNAVSGAFWEEPENPGVPSGHDGIISPITPVDQMTPTFTQNYRVEHKEVPCPAKTWCGEEGTNPVLEEVNTPSHFEGGQLEVLENYGDLTGFGVILEWASAGQEITNVNTVEGEAEIKG